MNMTLVLLVIIKNPLFYIVTEAIIHVQNIVVKNLIPVPEMVASSAQNNGSNNKQRINNNRPTALERKAAVVCRELK